MISTMETDQLKTYSEEGCRLDFNRTRLKTELGLKYLLHIISLMVFISRVHSDKQLGER